MQISLVNFQPPTYGPAALLQSRARLKVPAKNLPLVEEKRTSWLIPFLSTHTMKLMEQNEIDLVNKRLTQQLIDRQEDIMTRMLDAENAMKEQEFDNERKGQTADDFDQNIFK